MLKTGTVAVMLQVWRDPYPDILRFWITISHITPLPDDACHPCIGTLERGLNICKKLILIKKASRGEDPTSGRQVPA